MEAAREGDGIGARVIARFLGGGDAEKCPRSKRQIVEALSNLKDSGIYNEIEAELPPWPRQEEEAETESEPAETEIEPTTSTTPRQRPDRYKTKKARARCPKAKPIFNREVAQLFDSSAAIPAPSSTRLPLLPN
jgi:hypothetical protein